MGVFCANKALQLRLCFALANAFVLAAVSAVITAAKVEDEELVLIIFAESAGPVLNTFGLGTGTSAPSRARA